ncbi:MAG TPA: response regulator, partial [Thermoanaerobaculia bacterium]|nr:response regulator [Thermoanaerobaculia bacterium]
AAPEGAGAEPAAPPAAAPRVLVVDDDPGVRYLLRRLFHRIGWRVAEAADGHEALAQAGGDEPDLVVLDLKLPTLSGVEVLAALADSGRFGEPPVVVFTSAELSPEERRDLEARTLGVVDKSDEGFGDRLEAIARTVAAERSA